MMEAYGRASAGMRPRRHVAKDEEPPEIVRRYRAAVPPVVMPRRRFVVPLLAMMLGALALVGLGAFILLYFG